MKKLVLTAAVAAVALIAGPAIAQSKNLVKNGDFSATSTTSKNGAFELTAAGTYGTVTNWSSTGANGYNLLFNTATANSSVGAGYGEYNKNQSSTSKEYIRDAIPASAISGNFVALDGSVNYSSPLTQTIAGLIAGQAYSLSFDWMSNQIASRTGAVSDGLQVSIAGKTFTTATLDAPSAVIHSTYNFIYSAGASNVLSFLSVGTPAGQPPVVLLDNVSLSAVPEPASWAMMLVGVGMLGGSLRMRRRKLATAVA